MVLDPQLTLRNHTKHAADAANKRTTVLKTLSGPSWGLDKETLTTTYKATGQAVLSYAAPAWAALPSATSWNALQVAQNSALRVITGAHRMSAVDHLHEETRILPVRPRNNMMARQFWLQAHAPQHASHPLTVSNRPPRHIKQDIRVHDTALQPLLNTETELDPTVVRAGIKTIHTRTVSTVIQALCPNKVLGVPSPPISDLERTLPRETRTTLSQLRSGYSTFLRSYAARINPNVDPCCPVCLREEHTTAHLFLCRPTNLTPRDLWDNPVQVAEFLSLPTTRLL